jgi:pimeloyl-ACP methyl ester carboxylesterase
MADPIGATTTVRVGDGAHICAQAIGDRGDPAILLIAGAASSMDWWDDELCHRLAGRGRMVARFDHRDTGRSTAYPPGAPGYDGADLVRDVVAVLDALAIARAHVVGLSMGGGIAQRLALDHRDRIATLTLISTTSIGPAREGLPGMTEALRATLADEDPAPEWDDRDAVVDHIVDGARPYAGPEFDEAWTRAVAERAYDRSDDMAASLANHWLLDPGPSERADLGALEGLPTLVLHGTADPLFPPAHGRALADEIPGARLVELDGVGHEPPPPRTWDLVVDALIEQSGREVA